jgi:hypothetical protein
MSCGQTYQSEFADINAQPKESAADLKQDCELDALSLETYKASPLYNTPLGEMYWWEHEHQDLLNTTVGVGIAGALPSADDEPVSGAEDPGMSTLKPSEDGAICAAQSFYSDTGVLLADGRIVPIGSVKVGERVRTFDSKSGKSVNRSVSAVWIDEDDDLMDLRIRAANGSIAVVHATQHHLFWNPVEHAWIEADELASGDALLAAGGRVPLSGVVSVLGAGQWF